MFGAGRALRGEASEVFGLLAFPNWLVRRSAEGSRRIPVYVVGVLVVSEGLGPEVGIEAYLRQNRQSGLGAPWCSFEGLLAGVLNEAETDTVAGLCM